MTTWNPDSWMDVITMVVVTFMFVALPLLIKNHRTLGKLDRNVSNGHETPLRADLDDVRATLNDIRADLHHVRADIHQVRSEIRNERAHRIELENRLKP